MSEVLFPEKKLSVSQSTASAEVVFLCDWEDRYDKYEDLIGSVFEDDEHGYLICTSVDIEPLGDGEKAKLTAHYEVPSGEDASNLSAQENWHERYDFSTQALTVGRNLHWPDGTKVEDQSAFMLVPTATYVLSGVVKSVDFDLIKEALGCVNSTKWRGFEEETLLFKSFSASRGWNVVRGWSIWHIEYSFGFNPKTWQKFYNPKTGIFDYVLRPDGSALYPIADFSMLEFV